MSGFDSCAVMRQKMDGVKMKADELLLVAIELFPLGW